MNPELKKLTDEQAILERKIGEEFRKLPNYQKPCGCNKTHYFPWLEEEEEYNLVWICLNCGGHQDR